MHEVSTRSIDSRAGYGKILRSREGVAVNSFERMSEVIRYVEDNLAGNVDYAKAAELACCPRSQFQRFFSYMADIALSEYIRRRRLTLCAFELQQNKMDVIDVAVKYGYDSPASFSRAFKNFHGISPTEARKKGAVFNIYPKLILQIHDFEKERGESKVAMLGSIEFLELPATRVIGKYVKNGGGKNPVPALWKKCFQEKTFDALKHIKPVVDYYFGWMGEYDGNTKTFTYIAGILAPAGTPAPEGFDHRDLPPCTVANGFINGDFANGDVYKHSHELTVGGIHQNGYEPDYSYGWSAEAYAKDLPFEAEEGTINYFCPCKRVNK